MKLSYLIKGAEVRDRFLAEKLPVGVERSAVGTYETDGGELYILSFVMEKSTIAGAKTLSKLRRTLQDDVNTRVLADDASLKFASTLYPLFAEYERKMRLVITLAMCAEHDNFDNGLVKSLEGLTLEALGRQLFFDQSFQDKVKSRTKDSFKKDDLIDFVTELKEDTVWMQLFGKEPLSSVRDNYSNLCTMRNKVMHHKQITEMDYSCARRMLKTSIKELDVYSDKVRSDVSYLKRQAMHAADAAKIFRENCRSMLQDLDCGFERFAAALNSVHSISSQIDTTSFAPLTSAARSLVDGLGAIQAPGTALALETISQQNQLQKLIPSGMLSSLEACGLPNVDTSALGHIVSANVGTTVSWSDVFEAANDDDSIESEHNPESDEVEE